MTAPTGQAVPTFEASVRLLGDPAAPPSPEVVHRLSGATRADVPAFRAAWTALAPDRRRWLARTLLDAAEADFEVEFRHLFQALLDDGDPEVRAVAVAGLWEVCDVALMDRFTDLLRYDADAGVRAGAATALGSYVEQSELGRLTPELVERAVIALVAAAGNTAEDVLVRRRATESAGYASPAVADPVIEAALRSDAQPLRAGALRAIGNSADDRWAPEVMRGLEAADQELRFEAARAAGEIQLGDAVRRLVELAAGRDREVALEAIWALGEIGGTPARRALERLLADADEDDVTEAIEDALACAALADEEMPWGRL